MLSRQHQEPKALSSPSPANVKALCVCTALVSNGWHQGPGVDAAVPAGLAGQVNLDQIKVNMLVWQAGMTARSKCDMCGAAACAWAESLGCSRLPHFLLQSGATPSVCVDTGLSTTVCVAEAGAANVCTCIQPITRQATLPAACCTCSPYTARSATRVERKDTVCACKIQDPSRAEVLAAWRLHVGACEASTWLLLWVPYAALGCGPNHKGAMT